MSPVKSRLNSGFWFLLSVIIFLSAMISMLNSAFVKILVSMRSPILKGENSPQMSEGMNESKEERMGYEKTQSDANEVFKKIVHQDSEESE